MEGFYTYKLKGETERLAREYMDGKPSEDKAKALGLNYPSIAIEMEHGGLPRAYNQYPWLVEGMTHEGETAIFMCCPHDYQYGAFEPEDAEEVDEDDIRISDSGEIAIGDYFCSPPLCTRDFEGTETPSNFRINRDKYIETGIEGHIYKVFIAAGRSLHIVESHLKRIAELEKAASTTKQAVAEIAENLDNKVFVGLKNGNLRDVKVDIRVDDNGNQQVWLQGKKGKLANLLNGTDALAVQSNDHFKITDFDGYMYRIEPNTETAAGLALKRLFDKMAMVPDMGTYWQLHNPTAPTELKGLFHSKSKAGAKAPKLETVGGIHYLVYIIDENADKDACYPPDAIPVNLKEYLWRKADEMDERRGIKPPPLPEELSYMRPVKPAKPQP